uniref:hypothetical protein n=1 Tax=Tessaracoccus timonensis TaxID=2161816 RepID=UPI000D559671|nr:hypothetical protein [Tessaracoccus timonensis]
MIRFTPSAWRRGGEVVEHAADTVHTSAGSLRNPLLPDGDFEALELVGHASRIDAAAHRLDAAVAGALAQQAHDATTRARDDAARMVETASEYEAIEARSADVWAEEI